MQIDKGESSAIALALESEASTLIIDDYKARKLLSSQDFHLPEQLELLLEQSFWAKYHQ